MTPRREPSCLVLSLRLWGPLVNMGTGKEHVAGDWSLEQPRAHRHFLEFADFYAKVAFELLHGEVMSPLCPASLAPQRKTRPSISLAEPPRMPRPARAAVKRASSLWNSPGEGNPHQPPINTGEGGRR